jgi:hypothetical protein
VAAGSTSSFPILIGADRQRSSPGVAAGFVLGNDSQGIFFRLSKSGVQMIYTKMYSVSCFEQGVMQASLESSLRKYRFARADGHGKAILLQVDAFAQRV